MWATWLKPVPGGYGALCTFLSDLSSGAVVRSFGAGSGKVPLALMLGGLFIAVGQAISSNRAFNTFIAMVVTVMFAIATLLITRDNKMARRFLSEHPGPPTQESFLSA
jgi:hypothetical protein